MSKKEESYAINDELIDQKVELPVKSNKIKYAIVIASVVAFVAAASILLIGYFKFDWFKSETYKLDANINRATYQTSYFTEKKRIETEYSFTNGVHEKKLAYVTSTFVVVLTDRKKIAKDKFLDTASLIILDSTLKQEGAESELTRFQIFDKKTLKDLETNPNGSKYPMAMFKFYEDGTIEEIKVPDNMDKYNADNIVELIQNVIPKLTRNRTEDMSKGLEIKEKKKKNKRTIVETQAPRTYADLKGSRYSKYVETDIENDQVSNIRIDSSAYFQTPNEDIENADLGIKDFLYDTHSEINAIRTGEEKETSEIVEKISSKFNFITSKQLIENLLEQEKKEKEIPLEIIDIDDPETPLRNLGFNFNVDKTFNLKTISFLGQSFTIKYRIAVKNGNAINQIIISSNLGTASFGNDGISYTFSKTFSKRVQVFQFNFPPFPIISLGVYAGGSLTISVQFTSNTKTTLKLSLSGSLTATAEIKAGWDPVLSFAAGATGTIVKASGYAQISGSSVSKGYSVGGGQIVVYVVAKAAGQQVWKKDHTLFNGW